jgi:hypothetical protein
MPEDHAPSLGQPPDLAAMRDMVERRNREHAETLALLREFRLSMMEVERESWAIRVRRHLARIDGGRP